MCSPLDLPDCRILRILFLDFGYTSFSTVLAYLTREGASADMVTGWTGHKAVTLL